MFALSDFGMKESVVDCGEGRVEFFGYKKFDHKISW